VVLLLDSGPLGLITNPQGGAEAQACKAWLQDLTPAGHIALFPEIIAYEHRRELLLANLAQAITRLDGFKSVGAYLPVSEEAYLRAAALWASARRQGIPTQGIPTQGIPTQGIPTQGIPTQGIPTADRFALDADVILAAQAVTLNPGDWGQPNAAVVIATTNVGHLGRFANARLWRGIP